MGSCGPGGVPKIELLHPPPAHEWVGMSCTPSSEFLLLLSPSLGQSWQPGTCWFPSAHCFWDCPSAISWFPSTTLPARDAATGSALCQDAFRQTSWSHLPLKSAMGWPGPQKHLWPGRARPWQLSELGLREELQQRVNGSGHPRVVICRNQAGCDGQELG